MLNIYPSSLLKAVPALLLGYTLQVGAEVTTSTDSRHLTYRVPVNKSLLINLDRNVKSLTKGKDDIADITVLNPRQVLLRGNAIGGTNATVWDANNRVAMVLDVEVTHNLDGLKQKLYELMPNEHIAVRGAERCIVLSGEVSNLVNMDFAMKLAQGYAAAGIGGGASGGGVGGSSGGCGDSGGGGASGGGGGGNTKQFIVNMMHVGGEQQVMLEVKIAEVSRTLARALSLNSSASKTNLQDGSFLWDVASAGAGLFTGSYVAGATLFNWSLNFSKDTSLATVLAEPNLTTLSGQKASFLSGGEFPFTACTTATATTNGAFVPCTVNFKPFGVGLEFTPVVLDSNRINLTTHVSVSSLSNSANQILSTGVTDVLVPLQPTPSLDTREAISTLELADGQTMSIAGLISENNSNKQTQTPGFADIPIIGSLFRNRESANDKKELVILITPHLATPIPPDQIHLPTENYVAPDDIEFYLLGRMEARKSPIKMAQAPVFDSTTGGTTGQFGHQINDGGSQ